MPVFAYRGLAANGRSVAGVIDADSARGARGKLRDLGIFPTDLGEEAASARGSGWSLRSLMPVFQRRIPATELALMTRQMSALLGAGVQLIFPSGNRADYVSDGRYRAMFRFLAAGDAGRWIHALLHHDPQVRKEAYAKALALIQERAYVLPLYTLPIYYVAAKDLVFTAFPDEIIRFWEMSWK